VTISCFGSGQAGDASLNGSVSLSLTSSCDPGQNGQNVPSSDNNSGNVQTWNFGGILPGAAQQNSLSSCDLFGNACAADPCNFNTLAAGNILAASVGGF
jgi:hypothetical protein